MRTFRDRFADGTCWNDEEHFRMFWVHNPSGEATDLTHQRSFRVINTPQELDTRWAEILEIAEDGHMNPGVFRGYRHEATGLVEVVFPQNLMCGLLAFAAPNHEALASTLHVIELDNRQHTRIIMCTPCYHNFEGKRPGITKLIRTL